MAIRVFKNFWRQVVGSSTNCLFALAVVEHLGSETEVANLELHALSQEQVAKLEVPVNYLAVVHVFHAGNELMDVESSFDFVEALASTDQVTETLVVANVKQNVDVFFVFEISVKTHHIFVVQTPVDFDFAR